MVEAEGKARLGRRGHILLGVYRFVTIIALGMPLVVVAAYYLFGWQVAVLAFPLLLFSLLAASRRRAEEVRPRKNFGRLLAVSLLWIVPIAATLTGDAEIMRLWAYATAIPLALFMGTDPRAARNLTADRLNVPSRWVKIVHFFIWAIVGALFVSGSELIWLKASIGGWIWYHAFGVPILMVCMLVLYELMERIVRPTPKRTFYEVGPPPSLQDEKSKSVGASSRWPSLGLGLTYGAVNLAQAQAIATDPDWACSKLIEKVGDQPGELHPPEFMCVFVGSAMTFSPDGDGTTHVEWHFSEAPKGFQVMGPIHMFKARHVPTALVPQLLAVAWEDDFEQLATLLASHIYFRKTS